MKRKIIMKIKMNNIEATEWTDAVYKGIQISFTQNGVNEPLVRVETSDDGEIKIIVWGGPQDDEPINIITLYEKEFEEEP